MTDSKKARHKKAKARRAELEVRRLKAYRRRKGLTKDEEEADLASYFRRIVAFSLDQIVYFVLSFVLIIFSSIFVGSKATTAIFGLVPLVVVGIFYFVVPIAKSGQTFGCRKTGIIIIRQDGSGYLSLPKSLVRWTISLALPSSIPISITAFSSSPKAFAIAAFLNLVIILMVAAPILKSSNRQGIHDALAGSVVIKELNLAKE